MLSKCISKKIMLIVPLVHCYSHHMSNNLNKSNIVVHFYTTLKCHRGANVSEIVNRKFQFTANQRKLCWSFFYVYSRIYIFSLFAKWFKNVKKYVLKMN